MQNGGWMEDLADWLDAYPWLWFCTLTSRPGLSEAQVRWRLRLWATELGDTLGTRDFRWVAVPENGVTGMHFHYHALIAGLKPECGAAERLQYMRRWWKLAGDAQIEAFKPDSGGVRYVLKRVGPRDMDSLEIHLQKETSARITQTRSMQPIRNNFTQGE
jgi:hypothetical protein